MNSGIWASLNWVTQVDGAGIWRRKDFRAWTGKCGLARMVGRRHVDTLGIALKLGREIVMFASAEQRTELYTTLDLVSITDNAPLRT